MGFVIFLAFSQKSHPPSQNLFFSKKIIHYVIFIFTFSQQTKVYLEKPGSFNIFTQVRDASRIACFRMSFQPTAFVVHAEN